MANEIYHDHGQSVLSALKLNFDSDDCHKIYIVCNSGVKIRVSSSFLRNFSKVISSTTSSIHESDHVVLVPLKHSAIEHLLMFLYNGELFSADKETLIEVIEAAQILDIDSKNWSIEYVGNDVVQCEKDELNDEENNQIKNFSIKEEVQEFNEVEWNFDDENKQTKTHLCQVCGEIFSSSAKLTKHFNASHSQVKVETVKEENRECLTCEYCGYVSADKSTLRGHIQGKHGEAKFRCDHCPFTSSWKRNLNQHKSSACKNRAQFMETEGVFVCDRCDKLFKSSLGLQCHQTNYHGKGSIESRTCNDCGYVAVDKSALRVHVLGKHGEIKFECNQCTFTTNWKSNLRKHKKVCRNQPGLLVCDQCNKVYRSKTRLLYHITSFHGKKENLTCEHCGYVGSAKVMKQHMQGKHGEAIFSCDKCSFTSSWRNNMKKHEKKSASNENRVK